MEKIISLIASFSLFLSVEAQYENRKNVGDFTGIEVNSAARVSIFQSDSNYVLLSSDAVIKKEPRIEVHGGVLEVTSPFNGSVNIYTKNITSIKVDDAGRVICKDTLKSTILNLHVSDAGRADILVHAKIIKVRANDASNITLSGAADSLDVKSSDASRVNGFALKARSVRAISSDGSNVSVWAINSINAEASDGSNVHIKGSPASRNTTASEGGSVTMDDSGEETTRENGRHSVSSVLDKDTIFGKKNSSHNMGEAFAGFGFVTGGNKLAPVKYGSSREFIIGIGGGYKFCKWDGLGYDVYYKSTGFYLAQNSGKNFPDTLKHDAQKVSLQNFGGLIYDRFIFTSGYHGQLALDLGFFGDWTFNSREVTWDNNNDVKTINRNLSFFNHGNYGVTARFIFVRQLSVYFNYRLSDVFKSSVGSTQYSPTLPACVLGITFGVGE